MADESDYVVVSSGHKLSSVWVWVWVCCVHTPYIPCIYMYCWSLCGGPSLANKASAAHILKTNTKYGTTPYILDPHREQSPQ